MRDTFCGWYFRCQSEEHTLAFIPAVHGTKGAHIASIQIISDTGSWNAILPASASIQMCAHSPDAAFGSSVFQKDGIRLDLRTEELEAVGALRFDALSPIRYDIMGPFRYVPWMECRHHIGSMRHTVHGNLRINGKQYRFPNGTGYIEGDRGRSFPKRYAWTQCFLPHGSLMLSVADIPLGPVSFTGIISVIHLKGKEYRLATYLGAKAVNIGNREVTIRQGRWTLTACLLEERAYFLRSPVRGAMTRMIRENTACRARYRFSRNEQVVFDFETPNAAFEYEYP